MELRHKKEKPDFSNVEKEEPKKEWYNKLWDVTARMGKTLAKTLCVVSVPVIVASCTCSRIELEGDTHTTPDIADVSHDDAREDVHEEDTVSEDVLPEDVVEEDVPEEELPSPCDYLYERSGINNLIGDYLNRRLDDRLDNVPHTDPSYTDAAYSIGGSDVSENANPFTDGVGGSIGPNEVYMYRITGGTFSPLMDSTVYDDSAAKTYTQEQNIWVRGSSYYSDSLDDVTGDVRFVAYTMKFGGDSNDFGIPVCTTPINGDYTYCKSDAEDANYDYSTESHRVLVSFLGEPWVVTEMSPSYTEVADEALVQNGGYIKIAREAVYGIINQGESLPADGLRFQLDDLEEHGGVVSAIISVLDEDDNILVRDVVSPGQTKEFNIDGELYKLHVYNVAPGYTEEAKWAGMAILSREIKIEDGQHLDPDYDTYREWQTFVTWKNKGASTTDTKPDHLRRVGIYADDIASISTSGETTLLAGDGFGFPESSVALCYGGLDITDEKRNTLTFRLERESDYIISDSKGPIDPVSGERVDCVIYAPFVKISSEVNLLWSSGDAALMLDGDAYIATGGAHCDGTIGSLDPGSLFMKIAPTSTYYGFVEYEPHMLTAVINVVDYPEGATMGGINWSKWEDGVNFINPERPVNIDAQFVFWVYENARGGVDHMYFATDGTSLNQDIYYTDTGERVFRSGDIVYQYAGPVNEADTYSFAEEGYITERGSVFSSISDTQVEYYVSDRVAYSVYYIGFFE